jgi:LacI family transcriptional regulator
MGLIASLSFDTEDLTHFKQFQSKNIPVVFFDRVFENSETAKVIINNFQAGYDATSHLINQGLQTYCAYYVKLKKKCVRGKKARIQAGFGRS